MRFEASCLHPGLFWHPSRQMYLVSHVDDLLILGTRSDLINFKAEFALHYEIKGALLEASHPISYLRRQISFQSDGVHWEGDERHVKTLMDEWGVENCNPVDTPHWDRHHDTERIQRETMSKEKAKEFRRGVARINYMS